MPYGLSSTTLQKLAEVFMKFEKIESTTLYGSRALGNYTEGSDIDLVISGKNIDLSDLHKIYFAIDDLLLPYSIDLNTLNFIKNAELLEHIERVGIIIYIKKT